MNYQWSIASEAPLDKQTQDQRDLATQTTISVVFGLSAFLTFCFLRPRWTSLYAARKVQKNAAATLPELPDSFFGWIPVVYRISEEEVLATAGLDAFVFLAFFKLAIKFLVFVLFFSLTVVYPVHLNFDNLQPPGSNQTTLFTSYYQHARPISHTAHSIWDVEKESKNSNGSNTGYLWIYVVFVYLYSSIALWMIASETKKIITVRQKYLGTHSTLTDRTIRLSGIPPHLQSEESIKETVEDLSIGKVESVMLCRDWKTLDDLMAERMKILRRLEEVWTAYMDHSRDEIKKLSIRSPAAESVVDRNGDSEGTGLLDRNGRNQAHVTSHTGNRPTKTIRYGFLNLQSRKIDAIDYYEEQLRNYDKNIKDARQQEYRPTPLAFVTLDSTAACQMAVQAIIDPLPLQLIASAAPAPADVVWKNTYLPRSTRMLRAWIITSVVVILTIFWIFLVVPIAGLISIETIDKVWPQLANFLREHTIVQSLVRTGLPTLILSLLNSSVPYLYDWLSNTQGMISQGDVEMSVISKNFFFTFFNLFIVFTVFGTASTFQEAQNELGEQLKDLSRIAWVLATSLGRVGPFYINLLVLQSLGLFPFRLLEFGSVALYPVWLLGIKTPRDYSELVQPPIFSYGFYLPQVLFIFIICIVYSILPNSELLIFFGLIYFIFGAFIYKYQLLYAMDHRQHSTGRAWPIICNRVLIGLFVFQLAMLGQLALLSAIKRSILILPPLIGTVWFAYFYRHTYEPLMKFIALRSLADQSDPMHLAESRYDLETDRGRLVDESEETGPRFINPNLTSALHDPWISEQCANERNEGSFGDSEDV